MSVLSASRLLLLAAALFVAMLGSASAQSRPDLDALVYGGAASASAAQPPAVIMQQPQQPAQRGLFNAISAGNARSSGGAISALGSMFNRAPRGAAPQPMDAQAAMAQPIQAQSSQQPAIQTAPDTSSEPARAPTQRGLLTGSRLAPSSGNGAIAALGRGMRPSQREAYAPAPVRYAPQPLPLAPPTYDQTYRVDAGDRLRIVVYGQDGLTNTYQIAASGSITMPLIGGVPARGRTPAELAAAITGRLRDGFIREPSVAVEIEAYRPFFILGEVAAPGQYPYVPHMSVESAIAIAGGFSPRAKRDRVTLTHSMPEGLLRAVVPPNTPLSPGDTIMVGERWF